MSGVDLDGRQIRKGAAEASSDLSESTAAKFPAEVRRVVDEIARKGGTPLVVAEGTQTLGVIYLKDIVKGGIKERFAELRRMGIKTVMITGDNPLTAAAIAAEAGVDDFLAEATPEAKLKMIREYQAGGRLVAMTGDGTNDSPALAQADVAVAMNSGTQAAKEAGNMVDLDSNPTKLIEIVEIGKQLLMTRGSLTTFSLANDVAKYFAIIPAAFATHVSGARQAERDAAGDAVQRDPVGGDLQRAYHRAVDSAGAARRAVPAGRCGQAAAPQPADLRFGWADRAVHRNQVDRHARVCFEARVGGATMFAQLRAALGLFTLLTVLTGIVYPLFVTAVAQTVFSHQANGSPVERDGTLIGSELIGQPFEEPRYFWGRPSATAPMRTTLRLRRAQIWAPPIPHCSMRSRNASLGSSKRTQISRDRFPPIS